MSHAVLLARRAAKELEQAARWWATHHSAAEAERWYNGFLRQLRSLESDPARCPLARENDAFVYEVRQMAYGLGRHFTHRAVFTIRENDVVVFTVRHLAQSDITPDDVD